MFKYPSKIYFNWISTFVCFIIDIHLWISMIWFVYIGSDSGSTLHRLYTTSKSAIRVAAADAYTITEQLPPQSPSHDDTKCFWRDFQMKAQ